MITAPLWGRLADRYSGKLIIASGSDFMEPADVCSPQFTHNYTEFLVRHTLVGIGEATSFLSRPRLSPICLRREMRGRILGVFYLAIPVGSAAGYLLGGQSRAALRMAFSPLHCGRSGLSVLAIAVLFLKEPKRGQFDSLTETLARAQDARTWRATQHF